MIVRVHKVGSSFKGCAAYLLHDKDAASAERVDWVETHNLGTDNPQTAWRIMAATAMKQAELKKAAGLKATGNKAKGTVLHFSLSWQQGAEPTKAHMIEAAKSSLAVIGIDPEASNAKKKAARRQFADEHQAMIVCHTDEKHPHVHIMVNRVHPEHGAILPSSNDRVKLSDWALGYELTHDGKVLCENRENNQDMRKRQLYVKGGANLPRHSWEMTQEALGKQANDNDSPALQRLKSAQKAENDQLAIDGGGLAARHKQAWNDLSSEHKARQSAFRLERLKTIAEAKKASVREYSPKFSTMKKRHALERDAFQADENGVRSKAGNVWESMKLLAKIRGEDGDDLRLRDVFSPFAGAGARLDILKRAHAQEKFLLRREQDAKLAAATDAAKAQEKLSKTENMARYTREKSALLFVQDGENAALKTRWHKRHEDQRTVYAEFAAKQTQRQALLDEYARQALEDMEEDNLQFREQSHDDGYDDGSAR